MCARVNSDLRLLPLRCLKTGEHDSLRFWSGCSAEANSLRRCWTPAQLKDMSSHFERPEEHLPDKLVQSIIKSKSAGQGLFNLRQIFHARYDSACIPLPSRCDC